MDSSAQEKDIKFAQIIAHSHHRGDFEVDQKYLDHFNNFSDHSCNIGLDFPSRAFVFVLEKEVTVEECEIGGLTVHTDVPDKLKGVKIETSTNGLFWTPVGDVPEDFESKIVKVPLQSSRAKMVKVVREVNYELATLDIGYFRITKFS